MKNISRKTPSRHKTADTGKPETDSRLERIRSAAKPDPKPPTPGTAVLDRWATMRPAELRARLGISASTEYRMRLAGLLPEPVNLTPSGRIKGYRVADLEPLFGAIAEGGFAHVR